MKTNRILLLVTEKGGIIFYALESCLRLIQQFQSWVGSLTSRGLLKVVIELSALFPLSQKFIWKSLAGITSTLRTIII